VRTVEINAHEAAAQSAVVFGLALNIVPVRKVPIVVATCHEGGNTQKYWRSYDVRNGALQPDSIDVAQQYIEAQMQYLDHTRTTNTSTSMLDTELTVCRMNGARTLLTSLVL